MLLMNPNSAAASDKKSIPIFVYELNLLKPEFKQLNYTLASSGAEQIAVDGVARAVDPDAKVSALTQGM